MSHTAEDLFRRGMAARLDDAECDLVRKCCTGFVEFPAKTLITQRAEPLDRSLLLISGFVGRHVLGPLRNKRQMVALEVPGDFVDLHSLPVGSLDHDVTAMTNVQLAQFPHKKLRRLIHEAPEVGLSLWRLTVVDAAIHRYWAFRNGALRAMARVANFLCEILARLDRAGLVKGMAFDLPLTQTDLGEACGMSSVHVNRVVRDLREAGCCTCRDGRVVVHDLAKMQELGQFEPTFLSMGAN